MKVRHTIALLVICFAIVGLTFTSMFFYDYNTKIVLVEEVQEEAAEDISSLENKSDGQHFHGWIEVITNSSDIRFHAGILFATQVDFKTSHGYFLDLIKPPIF